MTVGHECEISRTIVFLSVTSTIICGYFYYFLASACCYYKSQASPHKLGLLVYTNECEMLMNYRDE